MELTAVTSALLGNETRRTRTDVTAMALSMAPVVFLVAIAADIGATRLAQAPGVPLLVAVTLVWTFMGVLFIRESVSPLARTIALLVFTAPATVAAVIGPLLALAGMPPA